jgi:hypothetical protein
MQVSSTCHSRWRGGGRRESGPGDGPVASHDFALVGSRGVQRGRGSPARSTDGSCRARGGPSSTTSSTISSATRWSVSAAERNPANTYPRRLTQLRNALDLPTCEVEGRRSIGAAAACTLESLGRCLPAVSWPPSRQASNSSNAARAQPTAGRCSSTRRLSTPAPWLNALAPAVGCHRSPASLGGRS